MDADATTQAKKSGATASQHKTFLKWINFHLQEGAKAATAAPDEAKRASPTFQLAKGPIASLQTDLCDGKILCALLCQLTHSEKPPFNMERLQCLDLGERAHQTNATA